MMKPLHNLSLTHTPFQFAYNRTNGSDYRNIIHLHEGIEFHYIEQGEGQVVIGHKTFKISAGTLLFFQPFQLHKFAVQASDQQPFIRSFLVYDPNWLQPYIRIFPKMADFHHMLLKRAWGVQTMSDLDNHHPLIQHLQRMKQLPSQDSSKDHASEQHILFVLGFLDVLQQYWSDDKLEKAAIRTRKLGYAELAMEWIEQNYHLPFQLSKLAEHLHISPPYLSALFRREVGENLTDYLAARRIQEACHLLMTSSYALDRIAEQVGIPNVSYFCQMFKKQTNETPRRFRMKMN